VLSSRCGWGWIYSGAWTLVAVDVAWPDLVRDLAQVQAVTVALHGQRHRLGTDLTGSAHPTFAAAVPEGQRAGRRAGQRAGRGAGQFGLLNPLSA